MTPEPYLLTMEASIVNGGRVSYNEFRKLQYNGIYAKSVQVLSENKTIEISLNRLVSLPIPLPTLCKSKFSPGGGAHMDTACTHYRMMN
ncbi:hypothetical protein TREES_T100003200 [Tupaia chinensis]|uniref:Uncharacterized protein n=1 Tax=Tupaia chinensis TaxID=246437 RepID=L9KEX2_TUPCH|nr:hypothetical protein TREES_T100003200 [Tupaia chinensis]